MSHEIPIPFKAKSNPGQVKNYDNRDDRMQLACLLGHLAPMRRLEFLRWACSQAILPGTYGLHPSVAKSTVDLALKARDCNDAAGCLTIDVLTSLTHMSIDYSLSLSACIDRLVLMARGKV